MTETKFKVSLGAFLGSIIVGGVTYTSLTELKGRTLVPFCQENIKSYAVNSKTISTNSLKNEINVVKTDKEYVLEEQLEEVNKIELTIHSPWTKKEKAERDIISRYENQYFFDYESVPEEKLNEMMSLLESGNFKELIKNCDLNRTYVESPIIIPEEEIEENITKAEMTIYDIDYQDMQLEKQSMKEDFEESMFLVLATLIGGGLGSLVQQSYELEREIRNMDKKNKRKIKKL